MSWSVSAVGKAPAVKDSIAKQFAGSSKCTEPEETVRQAAMKLIDEALAAQGADMVVQVSASGSMGYKDWTNKTGLYNSLNISVSQHFGFVE